MKKFLTALLALSILFTMTSCKTSAKETDNTDAGKKYLVLYYSQTGTTKVVATEIARLLNADIEQIETITPYPDTYDATIQQCLQERESGTVPELKPLKSDIADYDVVFLGYPIWFGTYARPINALLASQDFAGKEIVPFCTFGSGGLESSAADLKKALPKASVKDGYGVRTARIDHMPAELNRFLIEQGYLEGEVTPLPDFSEMGELGETEQNIFDEAVYGYPYPLGSPVSVACRETPDGMEYKYVTNSEDADGNPTKGAIFILAAPDTKPIFTKVVR